MGQFIAFVILVLLLLAGLSVWLPSIFIFYNIFDFQKGVLFSKGRGATLVPLGPGWYCPLVSKLEIFDARSQFLAVPNQEIPSLDNITFKLSLQASFSIVDPIRMVSALADFHSEIYQTLHHQARGVFSTLSADDILAKRREIETLLFTEPRDKLAAFGIRLESLVIKDLGLPGEIKKSFAQVVLARKEGLAQLERARGETATLRHLANAARLMEDNPNLYHLRVLQTLETNSQNTVVLGSPPTSFPVENWVNGDRSKNPKRGGKSSPKPGPNKDPES